MKILLIEDDHEVSTMYKLQLESSGHAVNHASSAQAGFDALDEDEYDLIILDMLLPGSNGLVVLHELRSYQDWRQIPVVILSNVSPLDLGVKASHLKSLGVSEYLIKIDTTPRDLATAIKAYGNG